MYRGERVSVGLHNEDTTVTAKPVSWHHRATIVASTVVAVDAE